MLFYCAFIAVGRFVTALLNQPAHGEFRRTATLSLTAAWIYTWQMQRCFSRNSHTVMQQSREMSTYLHAGRNHVWVKMKLVWMLKVRDVQIRKCWCYISWHSKSFMDKNHQTHNIHLLQSLEMHLCQLFVSLLLKHKAVTGLQNCAISSLYGFFHPRLALARLSDLVLLPFCNNNSCHFNPAGCNTGAGWLCFQEVDFKERERKKK